MFKLLCKVQNYDWGKIGMNSFVAQIFAKNGKLNIIIIYISGGQIDSSKAYAEYWMGSHINGMSCIIKNGQEVSLLEYLKEKYNVNNGLPFLFKILSIKEPLSIQVHPTKTFAEILNKVDTTHYKDDNHKPELALALSDNFTAFYGMVSSSLAVIIIKFFYESLQLANELIESIDKFLNNPNNENYKQFIINLVKLSEEKNKIIISDIKSKLNNIYNDNEYLNKKSLIFSKIFDKYQYDRGVLFTLFMNFYELKKGESFFIGPNVPHAYIEGDIIECMANSDNVIRLGLTPKFIDTKNFIKVI